MRGKRAKALRRRYPHRPNPGRKLGGAGAALARSRRLAARAAKEAEERTTHDKGNG